MGVIKSHFNVFQDRGAVFTLSFSTTAWFASQNQRNKKQLTFLSSRSILNDPIQVFDVTVLQMQTSVVVFVCFTDRPKYIYIYIYIYLVRDIYIISGFVANIIRPCSYDEKIQALLCDAWRYLKERTAEGALKIIN